MKSDRVGFTTATTTRSAVVGDMYVQNVGAGATLMLYVELRGMYLMPHHFQQLVALRLQVVVTPFLFTSDDNFVVPATSKSKNIQLLMVGGGGGGGNDNGGGGGAGALIISPHSNRCRYASCSCWVRWCKRCHTRRSKSKW